MSFETPKPYVTITRGLRGYFAVLMSWDAAWNCYMPWQSGIGSYDSIDAAEPEAQDWAAGEGIEYKRPTEKAA